MDDTVALDVLAPRPALPEPTRLRWQPLRLGLVELFHYDSEEFWFRDGHLLLRGNNGTGKSKVLALTLPFLLDAQMRPSRIEPDGDPGKRMAWNLLVNNYPRRNGYTWIEFGRKTEEGQQRYLTLGAGLSAVDGRSDVESWFFLVEGDEAGPRIGEHLWLVNKSRVVHTRERLRDAIGANGQVFDTAAAYRRAVDERLFRLGPKRFEALIDTLIQLRQPQLSRKPDESALSNALTEALPPMPAELLADVADALNQLEEDRRQLEEFQQLVAAVERFERRYRVYAGTRTRREARALRQAQTDFDYASRARGEALAQLQQAQAVEAQAKAAREAAELTLTGHRARLDTLQADPTMQDANRLEAAERDSVRRRLELEEVRGLAATSGQRLEREAALTARCMEAAAQAEQSLAEHRADCAKAGRLPGLAGRLADHPLVALPAAQLCAMRARDVEAAQATLRALVAGRREEIAVLRGRHAALSEAVMRHEYCLRSLDERQEEFDAAAARRTDADEAVRHEGERLVEAWISHAESLRELRAEMASPLDALGAWVPKPDGDNPALAALQTARNEALWRLAAMESALDGERAAVHDEQSALEAEHAGLAAGEDRTPPIPYARSPDARAARPGAPLWKLIEFHPKVDPAARAGLESALEASGLLDAWLCPDGSMRLADGHSIAYDSYAVIRPQVQAGSLADWFCVASEKAAPPVPPAIVQRVLAGIACNDEDDGTAEAWICPDGRFRLGALAGAWRKDEPEYVGDAARAAARARRLAEIADRLEELAQAHAGIEAKYHALSAAREQAEREWRGAPSDQTLRQSHLAASAAAAAFRTASDRLAQAKSVADEAARAESAARGLFKRDAADLGIAPTPDGLRAAEEALDRFNDAHYRLVEAVRESRRVAPDLERQRGREEEARREWERLTDKVAAAAREAEEARARYDTLRDSVGARVDRLRQLLAAARAAVAESEEVLKTASTAHARAGEARAVAVTKTESAEAALDERSKTRAQAVANLQQFAATGLLSAALPDMEVPDLRSHWTIDPALTLARRAEQALAEVKDDDETWTRLQRQIGEDLQELQRALGALGHQAHAEISDWGMIVHIVYQNRPERPDILASRLTDEIAQRNELLTAREREVLENHLQAEIAAEILRLLQSAERQVIAINKELHKRPTVTGVRYRLVWTPLTEAEGAPVGLAAARRSLLNTSADLWSAEDRRAIGTMLQQRIIAERERSESSGGPEVGASLLDQLSRALDYRRWHRFQVQRYQDRDWRKLSGPASSGERALGLTVPLFAAVSSFYSQSGYAHAPRLILLDEAFAGIDDSARAHCMGLIREFDLDFVMTSEREWGCYAELPSVAICQLQRREGIDAVYVSRWSWDGKARRKEEDPDRRFPAA